MAIRYKESILEGSKNPVLDADVIQTANVVGYCLDRMSKNVPLYLDSEGDAHAKVDLKKATEKEVAPAMRDEFVELMMLSEMALLVYPIAAEYGGSGSTRFAPFKELFPAIVGGGGEYPRNDPRRLQVDTERAAAKWCQQLGEGKYPEGVGYRGQGAYTGVVHWTKENKHTHYSTTRWVLKPDVEYTNRWHPEESTPFGGMAGVGDKATERVYGMQRTNAHQASVENDEHMRFVGSPKQLDVVGYTHGLPMAVTAVVGSGTEGTPMEVAWGDRTKKMSSCFQCTVYMDACGFPASSVHLGRGESWIPPYPAQYEDEKLQEGAAKCLDRWYAQCHKNLVTGATILERGMHQVAPTHHAALKCLLRTLSNPAKTTAANLILDASAVHDKDYMRVIRTLWTTPTEKVAVMKARHEQQALKNYPD